MMQMDSGQLANRKNLRVICITSLSISISKLTDCTILYCSDFSPHSQEMINIKALVEDPTFSSFQIAKITSIISGGAKTPERHKLFV